MVKPRYHKCDVPDIDYSSANDGLILCTVCRRRWVLHPTYKEWWPNPCPECDTSASMCRHYGKRKRKKD